MLPEQRRSDTARLLPADGEVRERLLPAARAVEPAGPAACARVPEEAGVRELRCGRSVIGDRWQMGAFVCVFFVCVGNLVCAEL